MQKVDYDHQCIYCEKEIPIHLRTYDFDQKSFWCSECIDEMTKDYNDHMRSRFGKDYL